MKRRLTLICGIVGVLALVAAGLQGQFVLMARRPVKTSQITDSAIAALGGLRALGADLLGYGYERPVFRMFHGGPPVCCFPMMSPS